MSAVKKSRAYYHGKLEYLQYMKLPHSSVPIVLYTKDSITGDGV